MTNHYGKKITSRRGRMRHRTGRPRISYSPRPYDRIVRSPFRSSEDKIRYPSPNEIIDLNKRILVEIKAKKRDIHRVLSFEKIRVITDNLETMDGDVYDKATYLIVQLARRHAFDSGNRRTAYMATKGFLESNGAKFAPKTPPSDAEALSGIREHFYSDAEVKNWLQNGDIRKYERPWEKRK